MHLVAIACGRFGGRHDPAVAEHPCAHGCLVPNGAQELRGRAAQHPAVDQIAQCRGEQGERETAVQATEARQPLAHPDPLTNRCRQHVARRLCRDVLFLCHAALNRLRSITGFRVQRAPYGAASPATAHVRESEKAPPRRARR